MQPHSTQPPLPLVYEEWRPIAGYEGRYEVSNLGRVRSLTTRSGGHMLRPGWRGPYNKVALFQESATVYPSVHRLVAEAFVSNPNALPEVNHLNGVKTDNRAENLEWATRRSNAQHGARTGLTPTGERSRLTKLSAADVHFIRQARGHIPERTLARRFGVHRGTIQSIYQGRSWRYLA